MEKKEENKAFPDRSTQFVQLLHNSISLVLNHILEYCKVTTKRPVYLNEPVVNHTLFVLRNHFSCSWFEYTERSKYENLHKAFQTKHEVQLNRFWDRACTRLQHPDDSSWNRFSDGNSTTTYSIRIFE